MTKFRLFFLISLLAGFSFSFSACSSDDDDDNGNGSIVGTWETDLNASNQKVYMNGMDLGEGSPDQGYTAGSEYYFGKTITFNEDGTFVTEESNGTYTLSGNQLTITAKTKDGKEMTLKKGTADSALAEEFVGQEMEGVDLKSADFEKVEANINGDKMSIDMTMTMVAAIFGMEGDMTMKIEISQAFNRK